MTDLSTRPTVTGIAETCEVTNELSRPPLLVVLGETLAIRLDIVGARAARLSHAVRSGLPVPAGSVLTTAALGSLDQSSRICASTPADAVSDVFDSLGRGGQVPLMVSVSAVAPHDSMADRIVASHSVSSRSELLHTVRRLSATASMLDEEIAIVIQRDVDIAASGTLIASTSVTRIETSKGTRPDGGRHARLIELGRRAADVFDGQHTLTWVIDRCHQLWILDIEPNHTDS